MFKHNFCINNKIALKKENPQKPKRRKEWEIVYYLFIDDPLRMFVLIVNVHMCICTYRYKFIMMMTMTMMILLNMWTCRKVKNWLLHIEYKKKWENFMQVYVSLCGCGWRKEKKGKKMKIFFFSSLSISHSAL